ncbi:MAG: MFS transporter [Planctomycetota bacterium]
MANEPQAVARAAVSDGNDGASAPKRGVLGVVFLTVFLDMVGFSVIFPLFPAMLDWYVGREGTASLVGGLVSTLEGLVPNRFAVVALFGGALGALYSLLQFVAAPFWGRLSDRRGRRGVLLLTLFGTALSYVLWFFSGSFALLVVARLVGGAMAGNISIASASIADVLRGRDRAKGMGILGAGIGLGFVVGPAIGGAASGLDLTTSWSGAADAGVTPFSGAAAIAFVLALVNLLWAALRFPETNPAHTAGRVAANAHEGRSLNPFSKLRDLSFPGMRSLCVAHFVYSCAFGAMEFSLVFLATEFLGYGPMDNAKLFVFIGLTIALVQGGLVRRLVPKLGERVVAARGLSITLLGFVGLGMVAFDFAAGGARGALLWVGAGLVAVGTSLVMPSFSTLASRYVPDDRQGFALGVFRSLGSLARVVGPLAGGVMYYSLGGWSPYLIGAAVLLAPIAAANRLPAPPERAEDLGAAGSHLKAKALPSGGSAR